MTSRAKLLLHDPQAQMIHLNHDHQQSSNGYYALANHFKWALSSVFDNQDGILSTVPQRVIILEEDLEIAPDFFSFFAATAPIVESDASVLTASAWNDNGQIRNVRDVEQVYRSDFSWPRLADDSAIVGRVEAEVATSLLGRLVA